MGSERGEKTPTPKISALLRKRPVLLRANFVLTKDRKRPYYGHFCGKIHREGSCSKAPGVLSKDQMLNLVLGVVRADFLGRGCDEALFSEEKGFLSERGGGNSVNQGFGKDFYRKGNSVKRFGPVTEPPDSEN